MKLSCCYMTKKTSLLLFSALLLGCNKSSNSPTPKPIPLSHKLLGEKLFHCTYTSQSAGGNSYTQYGDEIDTIKLINDTTIFLYPDKLSLSLNDTIKAIHFSYATGSMGAMSFTEIYYYKTSDTIYLSRSYGSSGGSDATVCISY